mmetsp:Transcript_40380/g.94881  ORF Transcript_40380/g.94881 Transcript_40380/m.94881 type:complete len:133 (+) Transcript_40380:502-900(+)
MAIADIANLEAPLLAAMLKMGTKKKEKMNENKYRRIVGSGADRAVHSGKKLSFQTNNRKISSTSAKTFFSLLSRRSIRRSSCRGDEGHRLENRAQAKEEIRNLRDTDQGEIERIESVCSVHRSLRLPLYGRF